jgi:hypothetical protein
LQNGKSAQQLGKLGLATFLSWLNIYRSQPYDEGSYGTTPFQLEVGS